MARSAYYTDKPLHRKINIIVKNDAPPFCSMIIQWRCGTFFTFLRRDHGRFATFPHDAHALFMRVYCQSSLCPPALGGGEPCDCNWLRRPIPNRLHSYAMHVNVKKLNGQSSTRFDRRQMRNSQEMLARCSQSNSYLCGPVLLFRREAEGGGSGCR